MKMESKNKFLKKTLPICTAKNQHLFMRNDFLLLNNNIIIQ